MARTWRYGGVTDVTVKTQQPEFVPDSLPLTIATSLVHSYYRCLQWGLMGNDDNQDRERAVRDRIAIFFQADEQAQSKHASNEELQKLQNAVGRLDQLLTDAAADEQTQRNRITEEEAQGLRDAATRLDQLLADISGKDGAPGLKLRNRPNKDTAG